MATSLFEHEGINTTVAKAKELRPFAERLITLARRGDLHARRLVERRIKDKEVSHKLFAELGKRFAARPGGYTRIVKLGHRVGDGADTARIELLSEGGSDGVRAGGAGNERGTRAGPLFRLRHDPFASLFYLSHRCHPRYWRARRST